MYLLVDQMMLRIRSIPGYPEYGISTDGKVWVYARRDNRGRISGGRFLRPWTSKSGHLKISIGRAERKKREYIHRLVLEVFVGPCPAGMECRHLDGNPQNNHLSNLRWGSHKENVHDAIQHGTNSPPPAWAGSKNSQAKLTEAQVEVIFHGYHDGAANMAELSRAFNITLTNISYIVHKRSWKHILVK